MTWAELFNKLMSGRWLLTVACALAFGYSVWKRVLPPEAISAIITMVFVSYFERHDRKKEGN